MFSSGFQTVRSPQVRYRQLSKLTKKQNFRISKSKYVLASASWHHIDHDYDVSILACDYNSTMSVHVYTAFLSDQKSADGCPQDILYKQFQKSPGNP